MSRSGLSRFSGVFAVFLALAGASFAFPAQAFDFVLETTADTATQRELKNASRASLARDEKVTNPQDILAAAQADYRRMVIALYRRGYYGGVVHIYVDGREAANIAPLAVPASIDQVKIVVEQGRRFTFGQVSVAPLAADTAPTPGFERGALAASDRIKDAALAAVEGWRAQSHAKADIAGQKVVADHPNASLDVAIAIKPGPPVRFGKLITRGNRNVRSARIQEIAGLPSGSAFSPDDLAKVGKRLRRSGAFRSVAIAENEALGPGDTLDITATLVEERPRRFGFGAEISTFEGGLISGYWMHRNLLGGAERLRFDGEVAGIAGQTGGIDYALSALFTRPATFWTDTSLYAKASVALLDEPDFYSKQAELALGLEAIISDELEASLGIGTRFSDVRDDLGARSFFHFIIPAEAEWDRRNNELNPTGGFYLRAEALPFLGLNGAQSGARFFTDARSYRGLDKNDRFVLAGRFQLGSVVGASLAGTPPDLLFHSGGGGTVRGQPYQSLNVDLGGGNSAGGRGFIGASAEMRAGITEKIGVVGFIDAGVISASSLPNGASPMHAGAGLGLRFNTGIGPIRIDVAKPVAGNTGTNLQLYVGIGQAF
ncbi:MAG: autotransporter assembly complex protein TamA [Paracoccaceae bacterium]